MSSNLNSFVDVWIIYPDKDDQGMWVAHSINTDQLALGHCKLEAYVELKHVMKDLLNAAEADPTLRVMSPAPKEVRDMLKTAKPMAQDLLDRAEELLARNKKQSKDKEPSQTPPISIEEIQHAA
jgi:hypothetical protein